MTDSDNELFSRFGELNGLLKAHVKEVDRDRQAAKEWREEDRRLRDAEAAERKKLTETNASLVTSNATLRTELDDMNGRLKAIEPFIANLKMHLAVASLIVGGALSVLVYGLHLFAGNIRDVVIKLFK